MSDIVERLRDIVATAVVDWADISYNEHGTLSEAADEIERLRAEVSRLIEIELQFAPWTQS